MVNIDVGDFIRSIGMVVYVVLEVRIGGSGLYIVKVDVSFIFLKLYNRLVNCFRCIFWVLYFLRCYIFLCLGCNV